MSDATKRFVAFCSIYLQEALCHAVRVGPLLPSARKAIEQLRQLVQLAIADVEQRLGAPLPIVVQRSVQQWLSRAWEAGRDSRPSPEAALRVSAYLEKLERRDRALTLGRQRALTVELEQLWEQLTPDERALTQRHKP